MRYVATGRLRSFLRLLGGRLPGQLVVQLTDRYNASCPQCGMRGAFLSKGAQPTWAQDVRYYFACDFFDGRQPPDYDRLLRSSGVDGADPERGAGRAGPVQ